MNIINYNSINNVKKNNQNNEKMKAIRKWKHNFYYELQF